MCRVFMLILLALMTSAVCTPRVRAQKNYPSGVDIVFVVDQSGSMSRGSVIDLSRPGCQPMTDLCPRLKPTDPDSLAVRSLPDALNPILAQMLVRAEGRSQAELSQELHRFGLVLFGGKANGVSAITKIDLTDITINRDPQSGNLITNIEQKGLPTEAINMDETSFTAAFEKACEVLQCRTPPLPGRKRVVVLLTDGRPSDPYLPFQNAKPGDYFTRLAQQHQDLLGTAQLNVIGLDTTNQFWSVVEPFWTQLAARNGGDAVAVSTPTGIADQFRRIALRVVGEPPGAPRLCDSSSFVDVPPYKASLSLILEYRDTDTRAEFVLPDGTPLKAQPPQVERVQSRLTDSYIITNPPPGRWTCRVIGGPVDAQFRDFQGAFRFSEVSLSRPNSGSGSTCEDFTFTVSYKDVKNELIKEDPNYELQQTATITIGDKVITRNLLIDSPERDRWRLDDVLEPTAEGGVYPVSVNVHLKDGTLIYQGGSQSVAIDPKLPCMQIITPTNGEQSKTHTVLRPTNLNVAVLLTQGGVPGSIDPALFREGLDKILVARVEGPNNLVREVDLAPVKDQPGRFAGQVADLQTEGDYTFTVGLKATTQDGKSYELTPQSVSFKRVPDPMTGIVITALRIVASLLALLASGLVGFWIFLLSPPYPRGTLVFQQRTTGDVALVRDWETIKSIPLSRQRRFFGLFRTRWPTINKGLPKILGIKKLKVRRLISGKDEGVTVTAVRAAKQGSVTWQFPRDQQQRSLEGGNFRVVYENYGSKGRR